MQVLKAGDHKLLLLELDTEFVENIARQAGFEFRLDDQHRRLVLDLNAQGRQVPPAAVRRRRSCKPRLVFPLPVLCRWHQRSRAANPHPTGESTRPVRPCPAPCDPFTDQQGTSGDVPATESSSRDRADGLLGALQFPERLAEYRCRRVRRIGSEASRRTYGTRWEPQLAWRL